MTCQIEFHELQTFLMCSFRYALGRKTYIVKDVCELLTKYMGNIERYHQRKIIVEICEAIERNEAGMECDRQEWLKVVNCYNKSLQSEF